jgi:hypothetical protein
MLLGDSTLESLTPRVNVTSIKKFSVNGEHFISGIIASLKRGSRLQRLVQLSLALAK